MRAPGIWDGNTRDLGCELRGFGMEKPGIWDWNRRKAGKGICAPGNAQGSWDTGATPFHPFSLSKSRSLRASGIWENPVGNTEWSWDTGVGLLCFIPEIREWEKWNGVGWQDELQSPSEISCPSSFHGKGWIKDQRLQLIPDPSSHGKFPPLPTPAEVILPQPIPGKFPFAQILEEAKEGFWIPSPGLSRC